MAHQRIQGVRPLRSDPFFVPARGRRVLERLAQPIDRRPVPSRKGVAIGGQGNMGRGVSQLGRDVNDGLSVTDHPRCVAVPHIVEPDLSESGAPET
jgi:hypothetical protein